MEHQEVNDMKESKKDEIRIAFDGPAGSGKTYALHKLVSVLSRWGFNVLTVDSNKHSVVMRRVAEGAVAQQQCDQCGENKKCQFFGCWLGQPDRWICTRCNRKHRTQQSSAHPRTVSTFQASLWHAVLGDKNAHESCWKRGRRAVSSVEQLRRALKYQKSCARRP